MGEEDEGKILGGRRVLRPVVGGTTADAGSGTLNLKTAISRRTERFGGRETHSARSHTKQKKKGFWSEIMFGVASAPKVVVDGIFALSRNGRLKIGPPV